MNSWLLVLSFIFFAESIVLGGDQEWVDITASKGALAPNAGGQDAYSLRIHGGPGEGHAFLNRSLSVGGRPLFGAGYDLRFSGCDDCFWKFFIQTGGGLSNGGIYLEMDWGLAIPLLPIWLPRSPPKYVPQLRVDFATHLIFGQLRPSLWSYPLWLGITLPL